MLPATDTPIDLQLARAARTLTDTYLDRLHDYAAAVEDGRYSGGDDAATVSLTIAAATLPLVCAIRELTLTLDRVADRG